MNTAKNTTFACLFFLLTVPALPEAPTAPSKIYSYVGSFTFPNVPREKSPAIPLYYKGASVSTQEGGYIITDPRKHADFSIVVARLNPPKANTIERFTVPAGQKYLLCSLKRQPVYKPFSKVETAEETWDIAYTVEEGPFLVPEDSLVIVMEPTCVEKLSRPVWSKEGALVKLPMLTFKNDPQANMAFNRSLLASLDVEPFHKKDEVASRTNKKSISTIRKS